MILWSGHNTGNIGKDPVNGLLTLHGNTLSFSQLYGSAILEYRKKMAILKLNTAACKALILHTLFWWRSAGYKIFGYEQPYGKEIWKEKRNVIFWPGARTWDSCHMELYPFSKTQCCSEVQWIWKECPSLMRERLGRPPQGLLIPCLWSLWEGQIHASLSSLVMACLTARNRNPLNQAKAME